jgi:hypothetical protein
MAFSTRTIPVLEDTSEDHSDEEEANDDVEALDTSSTKDSDTGGHEHGENIKQEEIAAEESVGVARWRRMVNVMLMATAALVITSTYMFLSREEADEFEKSVSFRWWECSKRRCGERTDSRKRD